MSLSNWQEIRSYAYDLVLQNKVCYVHLSTDEKAIFTGLIIRNNKPIHAHEYITESDKNNELPYKLADYLVSIKSSDLQGTIERSESLVEYMTDNACEYASREIDRILEEMQDQVNYDKKFYAE